MQNKHKFILAVIGLFLVPFLLLSRHFLSGSRELGKSYTLRYLEMRTLSSARMVSETLNERYSLAGIAAEPRFKAGGSEARKSLLEKKVAEAPFIYTELALLGGGGGVAARASATKTPGSFDYSKTGAFAAAAKTAAPAGAVEYGEYTPPALVMVEPVGVSGGKPGQFLAGRLSLAYLGELIRLAGRNSHGNMGLVDAGGQVVADSARMSSVRPGMKVPGEIDSLLRAAASSGALNLSREIQSRGRSYLISVSNVPGSDWWFYEAVDSDRMPAFRAPRRAVKMVLSGVTLILIFGFFTYQLALRWLVPPAAGGKQ